MYCNLNFLHFQLQRKEREEEDEFELNIAMPALLTAYSAHLSCSYATQLLRNYYRRVPCYCHSALLLCTVQLAASAAQGQVGGHPGYPSLPAALGTHTVHP